MPHTITACRNCGSNELYTTNAHATGPYGPNLLPHLGGWFRNAKFELIACGACGETRFFIDPESLAKLPDSKWTRCDSSSASQFA